MQRTVKKRIPLSFPFPWRPWYRAACCLLVIGLFSGLSAHDGAESPTPDHTVWWMNPSADKTEYASGDELCRWWEWDGEGMWSCPRCGEAGNIPLLEKCIRCGYDRSNPGGYLLFPVRQAVVTNRYSSRHRAVDFGVPEGTAVYAAGDGTVTEAIENDRSRGNVLKIAHGEGIETLYGHLQEILAPMGGYVRGGEVVALSGNSGASTGPHLHFEVINNGKSNDPLSYLSPWQ